MQSVCPECKNDIDLTPFEPLQMEDMLECDMCGISLMVAQIDGDSVQLEVADEGK